MKTPPAFAILVLLGTATHALPQGPLTPPGPPAPTMKSLDQVEPRIAINATNTPGEVGYQHRVSQPGSYYLTGNLSVTEPAGGIQVIAPGVTIDLNGFEMLRTAGGGDGIVATAAAKGLQIRNGTVRGFSVGISIPTEATGFALRSLTVRDCDGAGVLALGRGGEVASVRAINNGPSYGILTGPGASIVDCVVSDNRGVAGILAGEASTLRGCSAKDNTTQYGFAVGVGSTIVNCTASDNESASGVSAGFLIGPGSTVSDCSAGANDTTNATRGPSTGMGFDIGSRSQVRNCVAFENRGDGFRVAGRSLLRENVASGNGLGTGDGAGIHITGTDNRIESNNVSENKRGIDVDGTGNLVIKNSASGNTVNYEMVAQNRVGVIVAAPASGEIPANPAAGVGTTDPWANFTF